MSFQPVRHVVVSTEFEQGYGWVCTCSCGRRFCSFFNAWSAENMFHDHIAEFSTNKKRGE